MKRYLLSIIIAILPVLASAQTIHWLTFIDTEDKNVGQMDVNGREILYNHFVNVVNSALAEKGIKSNIQDIYGTDLTPEKCKEIVSNLKCGPNDIVIFYYIGHGTHGTEGGDKWPMMFMGANYVDTLIPLAWVHDQLKSKGAKLTATIGMCCNVYQGISRRDAPSFKVNYGNISISDTEKEAIQRMFLENKGDILITSASPGQSSYGDMTPLGPVDFFTFSLVTLFEDSAYEGNLNWSPLIKDVSYMVDLINNGKQTPVFDSNINAAPTTQGAPPASKPITVSPVAQTTSTAPSEPTAKQEVLNHLGVALDNLIDLRQTESNRIQQALALEKIFAPDAMVKVLSQDGNHVIDKSAPDAFFGRLATSRILLKVTPVNFKVRDNQIAELEVKEAYKK
ncbi:MAG: caspase family protein [Muribaculaceae bacterium]|nr:caspase family protein [Muribaculaceae bacterium]